MDEEHPPQPPDPELLNRQPKWFKPVFYGLIIASFLFVIALFLLAPRVIRGPHRHYDQNESSSNARQIGLALFEFETEYGAFPNESTIALVEKDFGTAIELSGTSSNALFRQLFASWITESESMFYAKTKDSRKPDGDFTPGHILEPKSCGFSYITGLSTNGVSAADAATTPIVLTPMIPGTTKFDPKPLGGKAVVLFIDNSTRTFDIHKDGHIYDKGINLLSPKHPVWKGKAPDIRYPE